MSTIAKPEIISNYKIHDTDTGSSEVQVALLTARIEEYVRADPAQWLWIHNRWPTARDIALTRDKKLAP